MYRGTTPTIEIELDFSTDVIDALYLTFKQCDEVVFEKTQDDMETDEYNLNIIRVKLTQEETLQLQCKNCVYMQVRAKLIDGTALAYEPFSFVVQDVFKEGEI